MPPCRDQPVPGRAAAAVACALLLLGCPLARPVDDRQPEENAMAHEPAQAQTWIHRSGASVVLQRREGSPVSTFQIWVDAGAAEEGGAEAGAAHMLEHLIFRGSRAEGAAALARAVEGVGGSVNAWTSHDATMYYATVPRSFGVDGLRLLGQAVLWPALDDDALEAEKLVVLEEIRRAADAPGRALRERLWAALWPDQALGRPVLGTPESVRGLDGDDVRAFHRRWYAPPHLSVVVVGDVGRADVERVLDELLEGSADPQVPRARPIAAPTEGPRALVDSRDVAQSQIVVAFPGPRVLTEDAAAVDVLTTLLGDGESSRLFDRVQRTLGLVEGIGASGWSTRSTGLITVSASFRAGPDRGVEDVLRALVHELARLTDSAAGGDEVSRAARRIGTGSVWARTTTQGTASRLGRVWSHGEGLDAEERYERAVATVTPAQVLDVARRYLRPEAATVAFLAGRDASVPPEADLAALWVDAWSDAAAQLAPVLLVRDANGVAVHACPSGMRIVVLEDATSPTFSIHAVAEGGVLREDDLSAGSLAVLAELLTAGTAVRDGAALAREIEGMGAGLAGVSGRATTGLQMSALSRDFEPAVALFAEALLSATLPPDEVERVRAETLARVRAQRDQPASVAWRQFEETLHAGHPFARSPLGTESSLAVLERADLVALREQVLDPARLVVAVVGDVRAERVVDVLSALLVRPDDGRSAGGAARAAHRWDGAGRTGPTWAETPLDRQQSHIVLGYPAPAADDADRAAMEVLAAVLGGQSGRLFTRLRDESGLAYSVSATASPGVERGSLGLYIATSTERTEEAVEGLRAEVARLREEPVSAEELDRARRLLIGRRESALQSTSSRSAALAVDVLQGRGADAVFGHAARISAVTAGDVAAVAERWLRPEWEVVSVVRGVPGGVAAPREE